VTPSSMLRQTRIDPTIPSDVNEDGNYNKGPGDLARMIKHKYPYGYILFTSHLLSVQLDYHPNANISITLTSQGKKPFICLDKPARETVLLAISRLSTSQSTSDSSTSYPLTSRGLCALLVRHTSGVPRRTLSGTSCSANSSPVARASKKTHHTQRV